MKYKAKHAMMALLLLALGNGVSLLAQPETAELREPEAVRVVAPVVPYDFARYGITGAVDVTFRIDDEGRTRDIEVESASHHEYAQSVVNALRGWRFEAPDVAGIKYRLPVRFN
jgi:TonB family protein